MRKKYIHGKILQLKVKAENDWQKICFFSLPNKAASQASIWQMSTQSLGWDHNTLLGASDSWCGYCFNSLEGDSWFVQLF